MKKSILIWMPSMYLGGAERSLIGLLQTLDYSQVDVDLFLNRHEGELMGEIPTEVYILPQEEHYACLAVPLNLVIRKGHFLIAISRLLAKLIAKLSDSNARDAGISGDYSYKFTKWMMPKIQQEKVYDLAISFVFPHYFVAEKVKARQKISWIHTDYTNVHIDVKSQVKMWDKYDKIISISESVTESFLKKFPSLEEKIYLIENILPKKNIIEKANAFDVRGEMLQSEVKNILSIGRFSYAKNFDNIPDICRKVISKGIDIRWYIIGYGNDDVLIQKRIQDYKMQNNVFMLGRKDNPYPYIQACDLYVQPSRYEGKAVTVREAQMLGKPVVISNFATAASQVEDGVDGIIAPMDNEECAECIAELLKNTEKMEKISSNCRERDYSNLKEIYKLYQIMENE